MSETVIKAKAVIVSTPLAGALAAGVFTASSEYVFRLMALYCVMASLFAGPAR
jgi:hypothetical protein